MGSTAGRSRSARPSPTATSASSRRFRSARTVDASIPAADELFYYVVVGRNSCGNGALGAAAAGPRPVISACTSDPLADGDGDGSVDLDDVCAAVSDPAQSDADHDAAGDACDPCPLDVSDDGDGDGLCGNLDNCPATANADQHNGDGDAQGDACDPCPADIANDGDGDGLCGNVDNCPKVRIQGSRMGTATVSGMPASLRGWARGRLA
jgi:hypothetical protein